VFAVGGEGTLTPVTERLFGSYPSPPGVAFSPDGHLLAVGEPGVSGSAVWMFAVAPSGTLTSLGSVPSGPELSSLAFSPDGRLLATADEWGDTVSTFSVGADGSLTPRGSFATGHFPRSLAFSPDGRLIAVANWGGSSVLMFTVGEDGALTSAGTTGITEFPKSLAFSPDGHLFAAAEFSSVSMFGVGEGGDFTPIGEPLPTQAESASWVEFSPPGGTLAVTSTNQTSSQIGTILMFSYPIGPPTATIDSPGDGRTFALGEAVTTSFSCADSEYGIGITSCTDSNGATDGVGSLDTSTAGTFTYTVTARSRDGLTGAISITYTVAGPTPTPTATMPTSRQAPVRISKVRLHKPTVTWCEGCTYPGTKLSFRLSAGADVRLVLQTKVHGHFRKVAVTTPRGRKGPNSFPVGRRWHRRLLPHRRTRILLQLRPNGNWTTEKTVKLTVR
jgi:6-phosphogluconolactonase (cycloisomerase 2 family)